MYLKLSANMGKPYVKYLSDDGWQTFVNPEPDCLNWKNLHLDHLRMLYDVLILNIINEKDAPFQVNI